MPDAEPDADADAEPDAEPRLVFVTAPDPGSARELARGLIESGLAACANLLPGMTSVYRWQGRIEEQTEVLLIFKTRAAHLEAFEARLGELHPYDVPECVAVRPDRVAAPYLAWLLEATP
jgi:periplasmic divalent cation tolerance protein